MDFKNELYYNYPAFASCSKFPTKNIYSYGFKKDYIQLKIELLKNTPIIQVDDFPKFAQNEVGGNYIATF